MGVTKEMTLAEIMQNTPGAVEVLLENGMHCLGCPSAQRETLDEACMAHGIDVDKILGKLNNK